MKEQGCIGLDLSLTGPAAAWIPKDWDGDTSRVKTSTWIDDDFPKSPTPEDKVKRWHRITHEVLTFVERHKAVAIGVEGYAFSARSSSVTKLAELGGIVRFALWSKEPKWLPVEVTASAARKLLLERVPRKNAKDWTIANVRRLKGEALYWTGDEVDAIVIANFTAHHIGWTPLSFPGLDV